MGHGDGSRTPRAAVWGMLPHRRWMRLTLGPSRQLTKTEETFTFTATQDFPVKNLQPATVTMYDYYETGETNQGHGPKVPGPAATPMALSCCLPLTSFGSLRGTDPLPTGHHPCCSR